MLIALLLAHAAVGGALLLGARWWRSWAFAIGSLPMIGVLAVIVSRWSGLVDGEVSTESATWVGGLDLTVSVRLDGFATLMVLLVCGVGVLVLAYGSSYFENEAASARIAGLLVLFAGSMLGLVLADHLIWLYVCWELTSVTSYLLIGRDQRTAGQRTAALQALLVTGAGGLAMLAGFVILGQESGTWSMSELLADPPTGVTAGAGVGLVLAGIFTKSAQVPFHFWLPGAMVAPTPISAYLHSATMVKAGVYLAARFAPAFAVMGYWRPVVIAVGLTTMVVGALRALRQDDLKLLLAHGTVSQLGLMMVLAGAGQPKATNAVCALLIAHALFKGALFLVVGLVDHQTGTRNRDEIDLGSGWSTVRVVAVASAASMAGLPPLAGFIAKESAYEAFVKGAGWDRATLIAIVAGSVLTFAYSARFAEPFLRRSHADDGTRTAPSGAFAGPAVLLGVGTIVAGVAASAVLGDLVRSAANALDPRVGEPDVKLWHGFNAALGLSGLTVALGFALFAGRNRVGRLQQTVSIPVRADDIFAALLRGMNATARRVTGFVQPGSLPLSIGIILVVVIGAPVIALLSNDFPTKGGPFSEIAAQPALAAVLVIAAVAVATLRRRFAAVLGLGAVGYAMAVVFAVQGAPDLALTQFAVETLSIVMFVLVIRHLPEQFQPQPLRSGVALRILVATGVATGVFVLAMATGTGTAERATSDEIIRQAEPEGGGQNIVNVILVDVRALDTLGEITVLAAAAVGVVALARIGRGPRRREESSADRTDDEVATR